jgi:hypothetical protein
VTRFDVETSHLDQFEVHQVGGRTILEYWIPAERLDEFNDHIVGQIEEVARFELVDGEVAEVRLDAKIGRTRPAVRGRLAMGRGGGPSG